jgi:acyl carrier protein
MPIREAIRNFIFENFILDVEDQLKDDDSLLEKGVIDSTGVLELVAFIEEKYGFTVEDEELVPENLDSIRNIAEFILRKTMAQQGNEVRQSVAP